MARRSLTDNADMDEAMKRGLAMLERGDYERIHAAAIDLIRQNVGNPTPYFLLARLAMDHRNFAKAEELFERACELGESDPLFWAGYARFLVTLGRQEKARRCADRAAELAIEDAFVADMVGVVYSR